MDDRPTDRPTDRLAPNPWTNAPMNPSGCGAPLSYLDWDMLKQLGAAVAESAVAFAAVAAAIELLADRGLVGRFPSLSPPAATTTTDKPAAGD